MGNVNKAVIIGYGGHGYVAVDILLKSGFTVAGYCEITEKKINPFNIPYFGKEIDFFGAANDFSAFVSIGSAVIREKTFSFLKKNNVIIINAIHPNAVIATCATIGTGVFVAANAVINPMCTIGNGVICNTASSIDHECTIGDFSHICPGTVLCGNVTVGKNSFIGANSTIIPGIRIGDNVIVGAGSTVVSNLLVQGTYAGSPARLLKQHRAQL
jgi:sugar O-acyltransferase (sialic acid O-acetyltransferase NeuD family)